MFNVTVFHLSLSLGVYGATVQRTLINKYKLPMYLCISTDVIVIRQDTAEKRVDHAFTPFGICGLEFRLDLTMNNLRFASDMQFSSDSKHLRYIIENGVR